MQLQKRKKTSLHSYKLYVPRQLCFDNDWEKSRDAQNENARNRVKITSKSHWSIFWSSYFTQLLVIFNGHYSAFRDKKKSKFKVEQNDLLNNELLKNGYAFFCF